MSDNPQAAVIDSLVEAYNDGDAARFASHFAEGARIFRFPDEVLQDGRAAIEANYRETFDKYPENRTQVAERMIVGRHVVDRERVTRTADSGSLDFLTIYTVEDDKIVRVDFVSAEPVGRP